MSLKKFRFLRSIWWGCFFKDFSWKYLMRLTAMIWRCTCRWFLEQVSIWSERPSSPDTGTPAIIHHAFIYICKNIKCFSYEQNFCLQKVNLSLNNCLNVSILNKSETLPAARTLAFWRESKSCWAQTWLSPPSGNWTSSSSAQRPSWCTPPVHQGIKVKNSQKITKESSPSHSASPSSSSLSCSELFEPGRESGDQGFAR